MLTKSSVNKIEWAKQVLTIEQNVSLKQRLKQQKKYANTLNNGEKAFIVRWKQTEEERNIMKEKKHIFRKYIQEAFDHNNFVREI
ncbi:unnamed protein product [Brachionus calyciflorus]|uniref:Uncharacterized protein n=1 Tax=Brachionus calyciflorus TaxID=104777 RepID=A0A814BRI0_9BILA|nr:unnamed protein product [Brachionus calyciflorus]